MRGVLYNETGIVLKNKRVSVMNRWQIAFLVVGILALAFIIAFPPQITMSKSVKFLPVTYGYPIDWLRFFLWSVVIVFVTVLGIGVNKSEHT